MSRIKILLTVVTYPLPSRSYDELVCTAGILENGTWIRIYPVPLNFLRGLRENGKKSSFKYTWIELDLTKRTDDFRPESFSPVNYDFRDIKIGESIEPKKNWFYRKELCLQNVWTDLAKLIESSKAPKNTSLATFKPSKITRFSWEETEREWKNTWKEVRKQGDLFANIDPEISLKKLPYKFYYHFEDENGKASRMMIEDWEIGQLYWNCFERANGNEDETLKKVRMKYENEFITKKDIHFFLGTTNKYHRRRMNNPFVIIGVFYPKKDPQMRLFNNN